MQVVKATMAFKVVNNSPGTPELAEIAIESSMKTSDNSVTALANRPASEPLDEQL